MPLAYGGTAAEHRAVREQAGLFDLCHMGRYLVAGPGAARLLEAVTPSTLSTLAVGQARYTVILNDHGGIVDDIIVTRRADDRFHLCVNAVGREPVRAALAPHLRAFDGALHDESDDIAQLAVQGPRCARLIQPLLSGPFPDFFFTAQGQWNGEHITVSRTGYTGELGVEIFVPVQAVESLWEHLVKRAVPCGLGARDTLRLEMGYPLYGHELTGTTSPVAAGLSWLVDWQRGDLPNRAELERDRDHPQQVLCGFVIDGPGIPREGCAVLADGREVGTVTSGNMSLSLGHGIGMAYLPVALSAVDTPLQVEVRGKRLAARVVRPPFYRHGSLKQQGV